MTLQELHNSEHAIFRPRCPVPPSMPPARAPYKRYRFRIGEFVEHEMGGFLSEVVWRSRTSNGKHIYGIHSTRGDDPVPDRLILGSVLVRGAAPDGYVSILVAGKAKEPRFA